MDERNSVGASVPDQALAVPAEPASSLAPTGFDPSRVRVRTVRQQIREIAETFRQQHGRNLDSIAHWNNGKTKRQIYDALLALDAETATGPDVAAIIGNNSWIGENCDLCDRRLDEWFEIGDQPDHEARWLEICSLCLSHLGAIAMEARRGETENTGSTAEGGDSAGRKASPKDHRHG